MNKLNKITKYRRVWLTGEKTIHKERLNEENGI